MRPSTQGRLLFVLRVSLQTHTHTSLNKRYPETHTYARILTADIHTEKKRLEWAFILIKVVEDSKYEGGNRKALSICIGSNLSERERRGERQECYLHADKRNAYAGSLINNKIKWNAIKIVPQGVRIEGLEEIRPLMTCIVLNWISRAVPIAGLTRLYAVLYDCNWKGVKCQINRSPCVMFYWKMIEEVLECSVCACAEGMKMPQNTSRWIWGVGHTMDGCVACWVTEEGDPLCYLADASSCVPEPLSRRLVTFSGCPWPCPLLSDPMSWPNLLSWLLLTPGHHS